MVAYTSPDKSWLQEMAKQELHVPLYMPNWEPFELESANRALGLGLTDAVLQRRMALFGGTARYTLTKNARFVDIGVEYIQKALSTIKDILDVQRCFEGSADEEKVVNQLMHYKIDDTKLWKAKLVPASKEVAALIHKQLQQSLNSQRQNLMIWLESAGKASAFYGWLLNNFVHEKLLKGGRFDMISLDDEQRNTDQLVLEPTVGSYKRFKFTVPLEEALLRDYQMPDSSTAQSIDSYYKSISSDDIVIFQITRNMNHDMDLEGIIALLDFLNLTEKVRADPTCAKIVFMVPWDMHNKFQRQRITKHPIFEGMTLDQVRTNDCAMVPAIKNQMKKKLNEKGINNIGLLLDASNTDCITFVQHVVDKFSLNLKKFENAEFVERIPQYVSGVDCSPQTGLPA
jgi:hypothetical protein